MKTVHYLFVLLFSVVLFACNDDNNELKTPDFSVLGITAVTINDSVYTVGDDLHLQNTDSTMTISGAGLQQNQMSGSLTYAIITRNQNTQDVEVTSRYSDVSIVETIDTTQNIESSRNKVTVIECKITRPGYEEDFTYRFGFVNFK